MDAAADELQVPCFDPLQSSAAGVVDRLLEESLEPPYPRVNAQS
jgi:hypothetical protein